MKGIIHCKNYVMVVIYVKTCNNYFIPFHFIIYIYVI